MKKSSAPLEASPYKSVAEELERLRKAFRALSQRYTARVESEITTLRDGVLAAAGGGGSPTESPETGAEAAKGPARKSAAAEKEADRIHDMRDMLTLLRTFEVTSGVARRRDFKQIESLLEELQLLARRWT